MALEDAMYWRIVTSASRSTESVAYIETHRESLRPISERPSMERRCFIGALAPFCDSDHGSGNPDCGLARYLLRARAQFVNRAVLQFRSFPRFKPSSPLHGGAAFSPRRD